MRIRGSLTRVPQQPITKAPKDVMPGWLFPTARRKGPIKITRTSKKGVRRVSRTRSRA